MDYSFRLTARVLLYAPSNRQDSTYSVFVCYTSCEALAGMRNRSVGPSLRIDLANNRTMSRHYHRATSCSCVGSILHGVDQLSYFTFQPVLHDWCNKGCGMCYPVCGLVHIKEPLLLIGKSSLCGSSRFPFSLS